MPRSTPTQPGPLSIQAMSSTAASSMPSPRDDARTQVGLDGARAPQRRGREAEAGRAAYVHEARAALLHDRVPAWHSPGLQPRVRAADGRVPGERAAHHRSSRSAPGSPPPGRSARRGRWSPTGSSTARSSAICASLTPSASCTTASGLPSHGSALKTSTWRKGSTRRSNQTSRAGGRSGVGAPAARGLVGGSRDQRGQLGPVRHGERDVRPARPPATGRPYACRRERAVGQHPDGASGAPS